MIAIVAIAKCENHYIREWVEHYHTLGADTIILGDNNDVDGERLDDVLGDYISNGFVRIKDCRGQKRIQAAFYKEVYCKYSSAFDWTGIFDCDEFLCLTKHKNIHDFLSDHIYDKFNVVRLNWMCFGDNGLVKVEDGDYRLQSRFTTPIERNKVICHIPVNCNSKTFIRGGIIDPEIGVHGCYDPACCNDRGELIPNNWYTDDISWDIAYLKHYNTKTLEEWMVKMKRGYADANWNNPAMLSFERFFMYNERTPEKEQYIQENWQR